MTALGWSREVVWRDTSVLAWFVVVYDSEKGFLVVDERHDYEVTEPLGDLAEAMRKANELNNGMLMAMAARSSR